MEVATVALDVQAGARSGLLVLVNGDQRYKGLLQQQKEIHTYQEKVENVDGAFEASDAVAGRNIIVLDDLYQSGATINEVGRTVRSQGARVVLGLAVTKTQKDV